MDIGHLGAGLALKKVDKETNIGFLFLAAMFLDIVFSVCVLLELETIPTKQEGWQYLFSTLPYSHGVLASLVWSALTFVFVLVVWQKRGWRTAAIFAAAVFSHFILDLVYFAPQIPRDLISVIQFLIVMGGVWLYLSATQKRTFMSMMGLIISGTVLVVVINYLPLLVFLQIGQGSGAQSPSRTTIGLLGIIQPLVMAGLAFLLDRSKVLEGRQAESNP